MAPFNEHAMAAVQSAQVVTYDEKTILVEAGGFTPVRWFLERGQQVGRSETSEEDEGRPTKKRKTGKPVPAKAITTSDQPSTDTIPLARVAIDLTFGEALATNPTSRTSRDRDGDFDGSTEVAVIAYGIGEDHNGIHMRLALPEHQGAVLRIELADTPKHILAHLRSIALPGPQKATLLGEAKSDYPATVTRCILKRATGKHHVVRLEASVAWRDGVSAFPSRVPGRAARVYSDYDVQAKIFPDVARAEQDHTQAWTPQDFYDSVHVPSRQEQCDFERVLSIDLYPFQKRAVKWMLAREGVELKDKELLPMQHADIRRGRLNFYQEAHDANGEACFINHMQGIVARQRPASDDYGTSGGLLAEEMGLGKTVELMALVALHTRPATLPGKVHDTASDTEVWPSRATLIVTPSSILPQWRSELGRHAPALKVMNYEGIPPASNKKAKAEHEILEDLTTNYDVVLTTYQVLAHEVHFAEDPPLRNLRSAPKFKRKRSPLVQVQFWRTVMDEAQMIESGITAAARVASRLPRINSWAVTGTPLPKGSAQDLHGLLLFLRLKPFDTDSRLWDNLVNNHRHVFKRIIGQIALRHTKAQIRDELRLPAQKRVVITMPFTAVEQQQYTQMFDAMCDELKVDTDGSPLTGDWSPNDPRTVEKMRQWLVRLRQTCLHPEVGKDNRKALGKGHGPLRTVLEVLSVMIDQNETNMRTQERVAVASHVLIGHIHGNASDDERRSEKALATYKEALETSIGLVQDARERLKAAQLETGLGTALSDTESEESNNENAPLIGALRSNLRTALQLQHICAFFSGNACYQIKANEDRVHPDSAEFTDLEKQETFFYDQAKAVRRELLHDAARKSEALMRQIRKLKEESRFTKMPRIQELPGLGGIESRRIVDKSDDLFDVIRDLCGVVQDWRAKMADFLLKPLVDEDESGNEITGDEYEDSTKQQDELYVYFDALKAMQADLNTSITGVKEPLIDHEVQYMIKMATAYLDPDVPEEFKLTVCHAPEKMLELYAIRNRLKSKAQKVGSVRGLIQEARTLETSMQWSDTNSRSGPEASFVKQHLTALQAVFTSYTKALSGLEKEVSFFRTTQNQRLEFYKQLQELSDAVAPYKEELDERLDEAAVRTASEKEEQHNNQLSTLRTKNRFLLHLRSESGSESAVCVICQSSFQNGVLTVCGHTFCKVCINTWWQAHRTCPVCKRALKTVDFHNITYRPSEMHAREEIGASTSSPTKESSSNVSTPSQQSTIYTSVDQDLMEEVKMIDLPRSYGTKIDTLARHLLWIRKNDAGAKSIVFSQYRDFLDVLAAAFKHSKIGATRLGVKGAVEKFRQDPSIDCLLLDAKTDSSGLTLVNATHVFICEPLIQTAVELQAIARVHRIGQTRQTTVWMYLVNDTVEESIYDISVARRMAHVQAHQYASRNGKSRSTTPAPPGEVAIEAADTEELQSASLSKLLTSGRTGGEVVVKDDLWQCLFGKSAGTGESIRQRIDDETAVVLDTRLRATAAERRRDG